MAKLHRFSRSVEPITITDSDDELDIVKDRVREEILFQRPTYQHQLGFPPPDSNESAKDLQNYDVLTSVSLSKRLHDKYCWCEGRIQKLEATIVNFVRGYKSTIPSTLLEFIVWWDIRWKCSTIWRNGFLNQYVNWKCSDMRIITHTWIGNWHYWTMLGMSLETWF